MGDAEEEKWNCHAQLAKQLGFLHERYLMPRHIVVRTATIVLAFWTFSATSRNKLWNAMSKRTNPGLKI
jgi:hypothetical protein